MLRRKICYEFSSIGNLLKSQWLHKQISRQTTTGPPAVLHAQPELLRAWAILRLSQIATRLRTFCSIFMGVYLPKNFHYKFLCLTNRRWAMELHCRLWSYATLSTCWCILPLVYIKCSIHFGALYHNCVTSEHSCSVRGFHVHEKGFLWWLYSSLISLIFISSALQYIRIIGICCLRLCNTLIILVVILGVV